ncbi:hypothetical protein ACH4YO_42175 [Streptomyces noursei]|uniref:hypothetical protein n=1 Tax=Streptomyces noursei TaxID=1971 RepID=UPI0033DC97B9
MSTLAVAAVTGPLAVGMHAAAIGSAAVIGKPGKVVAVIAGLEKEQCWTTRKGFLTRNGKARILFRQGCGPTGEFSYDGKTKQIKFDKSGDCISVAKSRKEGFNTSADEASAAFRAKCGTIEYYQAFTYDSKTKKVKVDGSGECLETTSVENGFRTSKNEDGAAIFSRPCGKALSTVRTEIFPLASLKPPAAMPLREVQAMRKLSDLVKYL